MIKEIALVFHRATMSWVQRRSICRSRSERCHDERRCRANLDPWEKIARGKFGCGYHVVSRRARREGDPIDNTKIGEITKIGKCDITGVLGRGGMGMVYRGRDPRIDRAVAIKTLTGAVAGEGDVLERFHAEARSLGLLRHPNIVTVYDL